MLSLKWNIIRHREHIQPFMCEIPTKNLNSFLINIYHSIANCQRSIVLINCLQTSEIESQTALVHFKLMKLTCVPHEIVFDELSQYRLMIGQFLLLGYH